MRFRWSQAAAVPAIVLATLGLVSCITTQFEAETSIPAPLVARIPIVVGVYFPPEFKAGVHEEKREGSQFAISLGKAQTEGFMRLMNAMFERVVPVASTAAGAATDPAIRGVLEPVLEEFAFITPSDSGTPLYAVSVRYRINGYTPQGELFDSWTFTGYGTEASSGIPLTGRPALERATGLAMRDAGAKLATELREQAVIRGLLPAEERLESVEILPQVD